MKKHWMLWKLNIKAAFFHLPKQLLTMSIFGILFCVMTIALYFGANAIGAETQKMNVAVVLPTESQSTQSMVNEDRYVRQAFEMLSNMESVSQVCTFSFVENEAQALDALRKGNITAVVIVPKQFISAIMNGENKPAQVVFAKSGANNTSALFQQMIQAGASDLATAQAGIYAVEDFARAQRLNSAQFVELELYMNMEYLSYALDRNVYFEQTKIGAHGMTFLQSLVISGVLLLLFFTTMSSATFLCSDNSEMLRAYHRMGIVRGEAMLSRIAGITLVLEIPVAILYGMGCLAGIRFPKVGMLISFVNHFSLATEQPEVLAQIVQQILMGILAWAAVIFLTYLMAAIVYRMSGKSLYGIVLLFLIVVVMLYACGAFSEIMILPRWVTILGDWLPIRGMMLLLQQIFTGVGSLRGWILTIGYSAFFCLCNGLLERRELQ